ncbi:MAG: hypothetical protein ABJH28_14775 [Paraglaciecola sp.]|uniref:hypothetical protein n=1 Tax=Paraglaciecola sp. TaxID=1920173 RepID=UPI00326385A3
MLLSATLIGEIIIVLAIVMAIVSYYLGKKKTTTPVITALIGFFSAFIPPLAFIFILVLVLKSDTPPKDVANI